MYVYDVRRTGTPKRPYEVWRKSVERGTEWTVYASKSAESAEKRAAELNRTPTQ